MRREVQSSGKSRAFINDTPASLAQVKELGEQLIDVHSQHQNLLLNKEEQDAVYIIRKAMNGMKADEAVDNLLNMFSRTRTNAELVQTVIRQKFI